MQLSEANRLVAGRDQPVSAPLRRGFVLKNNEHTPSPLNQLLSSRSGVGGGKGGKRRLALLLTAIWMCSSEPYDTHRPASWWAGMIGLDDPKGTTATRSVVTNLRELAERGFIEFVPGKAGYAPRVTLLNETGTGAAYKRPYEDTHPNYFRIPQALWTNDSLIGKLSARGLAMFLIVISYYNPKTNNGVDIWFSDKQFRDRHGLAEATRLNGMNELVNFGVLTMRERDTIVGSSEGHRVVRRRFYTLTTAYLPPAAGTNPRKPQQPLPRKTTP